MQFISRCLKIFPRLCGYLSASLILVFLVIISYAIIMRYAFNQPLLWSEELIGYLLVAAGFLGIGEVLIKRRHIAIDLLVPKLGAGMQKVCAVFGALLTLGVAIVFSWASWETLIFNKDFGLYSNGDLEVAIWITQVPMFIGACVLVLAALSNLVESCMGQSEGCLNKS